MASSVSSSSAIYFVPSYFVSLFSRLSFSSSSSSVCVRSFEVKSATKCDLVISHPLESLEALSEEQLTQLEEAANRMLDSAELPVARASASVDSTLHECRCGDSSVFHSSVSLEAAAADQAQANPKYRPPAIDRLAASCYYSLGSQSFGFSSSPDFPSSFACSSFAAIGIQKAKNRKAKREYEFTLLIGDAAVKYRQTEEQKAAEKAVKKGSEKEKEKVKEKEKIKNKEKEKKNNENDTDNVQRVLQLARDGEVEKLRQLLNLLKSAAYDSGFRAAKEPVNIPKLDAIGNF